MIGFFTNKILTKWPYKPEFHPSGGSLLSANWKGSRQIEFPIISLNSPLILIAFQTCYSRKTSAPLEVGLLDLELHLGMVVTMKNGHVSN